MSANCQCIEQQKAERKKNLQQLNRFCKKCYNVTVIKNQEKYGINKEKYKKERDEGRRNKRQNSRRLCRDHIVSSFFASFSTSHLFTIQTYIRPVCIYIVRQPQR